MKQTKRKELKILYPKYVLYILLKQDLIDL